MFPQLGEKYVVEFLVTLFFVVLGAFGVILRLYVGRLVQRLDEVATRLDSLENDRHKRWEEHLESAALRSLDIEKRLSRVELISETLFRSYDAAHTSPKRRSETVYD